MELTEGETVTIIISKKKETSEPEEEEPEQNNEITNTEIIENVTE